jgi:hypothetical protein
MKFIEAIFANQQTEMQRRKQMARSMFRTCIIAACISLVPLAASAQEVVHAMVGTVSSIDAIAKTIVLKTDDGSTSFFKEMKDPKTPIDFDKNIRTDATAADEFHKSGERAIVYYYGYGNSLTAVALRSLGPGPFTKVTGTVANLDKPEHSLLVKGQSGLIKSFKITSDTIAETSSGAAEGLHFNPGKGDQVRVNSTMVNGVLTAVFINTLVAN